MDPHEKEAKSKIAEIKAREEQEKRGWGRIYRISPQIWAQYRKNIEYVGTRGNNLDLLAHKIVVTHGAKPYIIPPSHHFSCYIIQVNAPCIYVLAKFPGEWEGFEPIPSDTGDVELIDLLPMSEIRPELYNE